MGSYGTGIPLPIPGPTTPACPRPDEILEHPPLDYLKKLQKMRIKDVPFVDIDPGVFNHALMNLDIGATPNPDNLNKTPVLGKGNIREGTYAGTQAALTHAYSRIQRSWESYFDVRQMEPTLPQDQDLEAKRKIYQYSAYPPGSQGAMPPVYPPHLQSIPAADDVPMTQIFNALGLAETIKLVQQVVPDKIVGKTAKWMASEAEKRENGDIGDAANQGAEMQAYVDYNMKNRKSGTDIAMGKNLGMMADWFSDRRFADQSFTGTNPTTITRVPQDLLNEFKEAAKANGDNYWAQQLPKMDPASLFVQDCRYFRKAVGAQPRDEMHNKEPTSDDNWSCASVTLFQLHDSGSLHPVAIVCDYMGCMKDSVTLFNKRHLPTDATRGEVTDWPWRYAKTCAQTADWVRHEIGVHLTRAHMIEEAIIVATHRQIPSSHVVFRTLQPHWYKTLSLNAAARTVLVPQIIKDLTGLSPDRLLSLVRYEYETFDYVKSYVPNDLAARGFPNTAEGLKGDKYKNYAYAKNMVSMWAVIRKYVMSMLETQYPRDRADRMIRDDKYVQAWCKEIQTDGYIKSFPTIQTLDQLCDAVTMCIHIASPFHTAVNYLQNFYQAFVMAKPASLCQPLPTSLAALNKYTERDLLSALPVGRQREWLLSVQVPWLLSFQVAGERSLLMFAHGQWQAHQTGDDQNSTMSKISETFFYDLVGLELEFHRTSMAMEEGSIPYMVMSPTTTAVSILI